MTPGTDDQVFSNPIVALGPPDLALLKVGPITQLLTVADDSQVLANLRLVLNRQLQIKLFIDGGPPSLAGRHG